MRLRNRGLVHKECLIHDLRLTSHATTKIRALGIQIHKISLAMTANPRSLKNPMPIGDTSIGRQGKKNLSLLNGANSATPKPPFVSISSKGCVAVTSAKYKAGFHLGSCASSCTCL